MPNAWIEKLNLFGPLSDTDKQLLEQACTRTRQVKARQDLISQSEVPDAVHLILEGFACRYKMLPAGGRSIFAYLVPGDTCDWHVFILKRMDHYIATLSACTVVDIPRSTVLEITAKYPAITRAMWWATLVDEAVVREWVVNVSRRSADQALAHLFCELLLRLEAVGLRVGNGFQLPLTQTELADTIGVSTVHANRVLQALREKELIEFNHGALKILNLPALRELAGFEPVYLHLQGGKETDS
jgi:CRP-like cAMP-binding protein